MGLNEREMKYGNKRVRSVMWEYIGNKCCVGLCGRNGGKCEKMWERRGMGNTLDRNVTWE